jgi:glycosyltransferase involved in cell wall biosynthesis
MPLNFYVGTRQFALGKQWVISNHNVTIFTSNSNHLTDKLPKFKGKFLKEVIDGIETLWIKTTSHKSSSGLKRILSWFHFEWQILTMEKNGIPKPDVIIVSSLSLISALTGAYFAWRYRCKFVFEVRDIWPLSPIVLAGISKWNPFMLFLAFIEKFAYEKADLIIGTIPNLQLHLNRIGIKKKAYCIPQGIDLDYYANDNKESLPEYLNEQLPKGKFVVAYAGAINVNNPLDGLIEAADFLRDEEIYFVILGDGDKKSSLMHKCQSLKLSKVIFIDKIPKSQVNCLLQKVSVTYDSFIPELAEYGISRNKWIDYMFAAKPVICSYSGYQSMINECNGGEFVPFGDSKSLAKVLLEYSKKSEKELKIIGQRCRDFILKERDFKTLAKSYFDLIFSEKYQQHKDC